MLFQSSVQMIDALQRAGKPFEMMLYTQKSHSVTGPEAHHLNAAMLHFLERRLKPALKADFGLRTRRLADQAGWVAAAEQARSSEDVHKTGAHLNRQARGLYASGLAYAALRFRRRRASKASPASPASVKPAVDGSGITPLEVVFTSNAGVGATLMSLRNHGSAPLNRRYVPPIPWLFTFQPACEANRLVGVMLTQYVDPVDSNGLDPEISVTIELTVVKVTPVKLSRTVPG